MPFQPMGIQGAFVFTPVRHEDSRGHFQESFKLSSLHEELGLDFEVKQVNQSTSAKGVIRGIHFSDLQFGQSKYVSCPKGAIWDVVVDLRLGSPTFAKWEGIELSSENGKSVLVSKGLGHAVLALDEGSVVSYLNSREYSPANERRIYPLDKDVAIDFAEIGHKFGIAKFHLSQDDSDAVVLERALTLGFLPEYEKED